MFTFKNHKKQEILLKAKEILNRRSGQLEFLMFFFSKQTKVNAQFLRRSGKSKNENEHENDGERTIFENFFNHGEIQKTFFGDMEKDFLFGGKGSFVRKNQICLWQHVQC